jgi:hypothetical protein
MFQDSIFMMRVRVGEEESCPRSGGSGQSSPGSFLHLE